MLGIEVHLWPLLELIHLDIHASMCTYMYVYKSTVLLGINLKYYVSSKSITVNRRIAYKS